MTALRLHLLGPMTVVAAETPLDGLDGTKPGALLAYLAAEKASTIQRSRLAAAFWPDLDEKAARNNLRQTLHHLRQRLRASGLDDERVLCLRRETARFDAEGPHWIDIDAVEREPACCGGDTRSRECREAVDALRAAVDVYRGPFLQSFTAVELPPPVMEWLVARRAALQRQTRRTLERLADCLVRSGALERAIACVRQYLHAEPLDEEAHRLIMRLRHDGEWYDEALQQYDRLAELLARELDVEPAPETTALRDRIRTVRDRADQERLSASETALERRAVTAVAVVIDVPEDPDGEQAARVLTEGAQRVGRVVEQFGGTPGRSHGGRLIVYFGFPVASDAATQQAVRAAYRIAAAEEGEPGARVAVHSERIVTGGNRALLDPCGELSDRALAIAERAPSGSCVVTEAVRERVGFLVNLAPLAADTPPLRCFRVTEDPGLAERVEVGRRRGELSPLIGRACELARLQSAWERACTDGFTAVSVEGEAGVGKTRLIDAALEAIESSGGDRVTARCSPDARHRPLHAVVDGLSGRLRGETADTGTTTSRFSPVGELSPDAQASLRQLLVAAGLEPPFDHDGASDPATARDDRLDALVSVLALLARRHPLAVVVEDLHWADSMTLMLIRRMLSQMSASRILLICTARPGTVYPWRQGDPIEQVSLTRLSETDSAELLTAIDASLPPSRRAGILAHADGIPLFLEELARQASRDEADDAVPASLEDLLTARLQTLGPAKPLAELAATMGRVFDLDDLAAASTLDGDEIGAGLEDLRKAGLVEPLAGGDENAAGRYRFRHALIREAVYQGQLASARRARHQRLAELLPERHPDLAGERPDVMADHLQGAGDHDGALPHLVRAGQQMLAQAAHEEAVYYFDRAIAIAETVNTAGTESEVLVESLLGRGLAEMARLGYGSPEVHEAFERAATLQGRDAPPWRAFLLLWAQWQTASSYVGFEYAQALADRMLALAADQDDRRMRIAAGYAQTNCRLSRGDVAGACHHFETGLALTDAGDHAALVTAFGENPGLAGRCFGALALWQAGHLRRARQVIGETVALAELTGHPPSQAFSQTFRALLARYEDDADTVLDAAQAVLAIAHRHEYALWLRAGHALRGWALAREGDASGLELIAAAVSDMRTVMYGESTVIACLHIDALVQGGRLEGARDAIQAALDDIERIGNPRFLPELILHRARTRAGLDADPEAVAADLEQAADYAGRTGMLMDELRVAITRLELNRPAGEDRPAGESALRAILQRLPEVADSALVVRARRLAGVTGAESARESGIQSA